MDKLHPSNNLHQEQNPAATVKPARYAYRTDWISTIIGTVIFMLLLLWFHHSYSASTKDFMFLSGLLGAAIGWACGFVATPYNAYESKRIGDVTKVASGIASGYVVAKLDRIFELFFQKSNLDQGLALPISFLVNTSICIVSFISIFILVYVSRAYSSEDFRRKYPENPRVFDK